MDNKARLDWLMEQHRMLDRKIDDITKHKVTHSEDIADLKKKRLQYRDEIAKLLKLLHEEYHERIEFDE